MLLTYSSEPVFFSELGKCGASPSVINEQCAVSTVGDRIIVRNGGKYYLYDLRENV